MRLTQPPVALGQPMFSESSTQQHPYGTVAVDNLGRKFRYVLAGATLTMGDWIQSPAAQPTHETCAVQATTAVGAVAIPITLGSTNAIVANEYVGGLAVVEHDPGKGYAYPIVSHAAAAGGATATLNIDPECPVQVQLTTSSRVTLVRNPWKNVIQAPSTTNTGVPVGVCVYPITSGYYGWILCHGPASAKIGGTPAVGTTVVLPGASAGQAATSTLESTGTLVPVGTMMSVAVSGDCCPIFVTIG